MRKKLSVFGSTGSIGDSVFKLIKHQKPYFKINILSAHKNYKKIINQIEIYKPKVFIIFDYKTYLKVKEKYKNKNIVILNKNNYEKFHFAKSDVSISAIPGIAGLQPTMLIIKNTKKLLIANKESVICGWLLLEKLIKKFKVEVIPIDSEHFSILSLLKKTKIKDIKHIYITASGGPFLNYPISKMKNIKPAQAVKHPKWKMGKKISIDSATLMNKLLEVVEAQKLFSINLKKIKILIHPQSLVHAIIKYKNGLSKFLYFKPDMRIPIGNALYGKNFKDNDLKDSNSKIEKLEFLDVDKKKFPAIRLKPILDKHISLPIVINAANEIFVDQFLKKNISFYSIINCLFILLKDPKLKKYAIKKPVNLKTILLVDNWARKKALIIANKNK